ncbi:hypothetical protein CDD81_5455 [Ophiocordyceps australis]|uniref:Zn(2)-C6 fungal-type domain-containing protein n=1 Tax=Ophiocordyceps australis TaxID=1399860 RepID=A0A2C5XIG3_9HYPO|nr:hypothetical protein CDD81_5455 [Ophiocordyceps australis]
MPPRRSHKKSRAGCRRCKNRKIKCDELHPRCGNCTKHGVLCDFENPQVVESFTPAPTPVDTALDGAHVTAPPSTNLQLGINGARPPSRSPKSPRPAAAPPPLTPSTAMTISPGHARHPDRLVEFRLLHHFITKTSSTLLINPHVAEDVWQRRVPQIAFDDKPYLMDAILSVAALHLRTECPDDRSLVRISHTYAASTLTQYRSCLDRAMSADNAEALFLTATLIAFQSSASRIFVKEETDADRAGSNDRYTLPMPWFHAFQGVKTIVAASWQWIRNSEVVKAVIDSQPSLQLDLNPLGPDSFFGHLLDGLEEELANEPQSHTQATSQAYSHAVSVLNWAHKNVHAPATLAFPASVSRRYVELVEEKRPRALVILACFFALLKRMDDVWWLKDAARREVTGLVNMFEPGSVWWRHLEWPVRISVWDGNTIPADVWGVECEEQPETSRRSVETMISHIEMLSASSGQVQASAPLLPGLGEYSSIPAPID